VSPAARGRLAAALFVVTGVALLATTPPPPPTSLERFYEGNALIGPGGESTHEVRFDPGSNLIDATVTVQAWWPSLVGTRDSEGLPVEIQVDELSPEAQVVVPFGGQPSTSFSAAEGERRYLVRLRSTVAAPPLSVSWEFRARMRYDEEGLRGRAAVTGEDAPGPPTNLLPVLGVVAGVPLSWLAWWRMSRLRNRNRDVLAAAVGLAVLVGLASVVVATAQPGFPQFGSLEAAQAANVALLVATIAVLLAGMARWRDGSPGVLLAGTGMAVGTLVPALSVLGATSPLSAALLAALLIAVVLVLATLVVAGPWFERSLEPLRDRALLMALSQPATAALFLWGGSVVGSGWSRGAFVDPSISIVAVPGILLPLALLWSTARWWAGGGVGWSLVISLLVTGVGLLLYLVAPVFVHGLLGSGYVQDAAPLRDSAIAVGIPTAAVIGGLCGLFVLIQGRRTLEQRRPFAGTTIEAPVPEVPTGTPSA
jgi:hypothetical protein